MDIAIPSNYGAEILVPITALKDGVAYDPTGDALTVAFILAGAKPILTDWTITGRWVTVGTRHNAAFIPTLGLTAGVYRAWFQIADDTTIELPSSNRIVIY